MQIFGWKGKLYGMRAINITVLSEVVMAPRTTGSSTFYIVISIT